jgi:hypothetical protein
MRELNCSGLPDEPRSLAIADDGKTLLVIGMKGIVYLLPQDSLPRFICSGEGFAAAAFKPASDSALIYDRKTGSLFLLQNLSSEPAQSFLVGGPENISEKASLWIDSDRAILMSADKNVLWQISMKDLEIKELPLPAKPAMLQPLRVSGNLLLSYQPGQPAWILEIGAKTTAPYFIPAQITDGKKPIPRPVDGPKPIIKDMPR